MMDNWTGAWTGAAAGATTLHATIVKTKAPDDPHKIITDHITDIKAVSVNTGIAKIVAAMNDTENMGGYSDFVEPVVVRMKGPSAMCIATPMRVQGFVVPTAAYTQAAETTIAAMVAYAAPRAHLTVSRDKCEWIRAMKSDGTKQPQAEAAVAAAIRLATRILAASQSSYNDAAARKSAHREFDVAVAAAAKLIE